MKPPTPVGLQTIRIAHALLDREEHPTRVALLRTVIDLQLLVVEVDAQRWALTRPPISEFIVSDYLAFFLEELN